MVLSSSTRKARKEHQCDYCCFEINKGEVYQYAALLGESNDVYTWKSHLDCEAIIDKLKMHQTFYDGLGESEFRYEIEDEFKEVTENHKLNPSFKYMLNKVIKFHLEK